MRAAVWVLLAVSGVAHAGDEADKARSEASAGETLAGQQKYVEAARRFRAAYRLDPKPEYLCNVGVAYHRAKELPRAQLYLGECLRKGQALDARFLALVRQAVAEVEAKLRAGDFAPVEVVVTPPGVALTISSFERDETFIGAQVVWLPYGAHTVGASLEGYVPAQRDVEVSSRKSQQLRIELARTPGGDRTPTPGEPSRPTESPQPDHGPLASRSTPRSKVAPIIASGVTLAAAGTAIGLFAHASSIMDSAGATTIRPTYDHRIERARTWQHASWAVAGAAGVGAVVSTLLWIRSSGSTTVEVTPTTSGGAVTLSGRW